MQDNSLNELIEKLKLIQNAKKILYLEQITYPKNRDPNCEAEQIRWDAHKYESGFKTDRLFRTFLEKKKFKMQCNWVLNQEFDIIAFKQTYKSTFSINSFERLITKAEFVKLVKKLRMSLT